MRRFRSWTRQHAAQLAVVAVLAIPAAVAAVFGTADLKEQRPLAQWPARPGSAAALLALPSQLDAWINDHLGGRRLLITANTTLRYALFREFPTVQMITGRHGRVFLAAHPNNGPTYSAITGVCGPGPVFDGVAPAAQFLNVLFSELELRGMQPTMLIAPSAPVLHFEDLPVWLSQRCAASHTPVADVLASPLLTQHVRERILYPLQQMRELKGGDAFYPKSWFHWAGPGLSQIVDWTMTQRSGAPPPAAPPLTMVTGEMISDVSHLMGGLRLASVVTRPDFPASNVSSCYGTDCFAEFGSAEDKLKDVSRFGNPAAPVRRRLLILSDSFGSKIAGWYARYYTSVEQVAGNDVPRLNRLETERVRDFLLRAPAETDVLIIYHDGGAIHKAIRQGMAPLIGNSLPLR